MSKKNTASGNDVVILTDKNEPAPSPGTDIVLESQIKKETAKIDITRQAVVGMVKKYGALTLKPIADKKQYEEVDAARKFVKGKAVAVENKRKAINETYHKITKAINTYAGELSQPLRALEDKLEEHCKVWEDEQAAEALRQQQADEEALNARITALEAAGIIFTGKYYGIGDSIALDIVTIKGFDQEQFDILLKNVAAEKAKIDEKAERQRLEDERLAQEQEDERNRLAEQKTAQEKKEKDLADQQDRLNNMMAEAKQTQIANRQSTLIGYGFTHNPTEKHFAYQHFNGTDAAIVLDTDIENLTGDEWAVWLDKSVKYRNKISDENQAEQKRLQAATDRRNERVAELKALGFVEISGGYRYRNEITEVNTDIVTHDIEAHTVKQWEQGLKIIKSILEDGNKKAVKILADREKQAEAERKKALSDFQKIQEYIQSLQVTRKESPQIQNNDLKLLLADFETQIGKSIGFFEDTAESILKN